MSTNEITTRTGRTWLGTDGIVRAVHLPGAIETLADAQENMEATARVCVGRAYPILVDLREVRSIDRPAREYYTNGSEARLNRAVALLVSSPVSRVIGNFFLRLNTPAVPAKLFTSEDDALAWLREFQD